MTDDAQSTRLSSHSTTLAAEYAKAGLDWEQELRQRAKSTRNVTLSKAGRSWVAYFRDTAGKRRGKSLGLIKGHPQNGTKGISARQARVLRDRLAVETAGGLVPTGAAPRLADYLERYLAGRTDVAPSTLRLHELTCRYLVAHFGAATRIDRIDRAAARDWHAAQKPNAPSAVASVGSPPGMLNPRCFSSSSIPVHDCSLSR